MLKPLEPLIAKARASTPEEFAASHRHPVFVFESFPRPADSQASFKTLAPGEGAESTGRAVAILKKRAGANAFGMMITLGRAGNNDIKVPARDVSKFHAYITLDPVSGTATLVDAGSTLGTFVGERQLESQVGRAELEDGSEVRFGETVHATYFGPKALHAYLIQLVT